MANTLESVVAVTNLAAGATSAALPHGLNLDGRALIPDYVFRDNDVFTIVAVTSTTITVRNDGPAIASGNFRCLYEYSTQRVYGNAATTQLSPAPFIPGGASGGSAAFSYIQLGGVYLYSGAADPNTLTLAPVPTAGSLYLQTDGTMWSNLDGGNTGTSWLNDRNSTSAVFGDGSDGVLTVAGTTTEAGAADRFYSDGNIGALGVYNTAGRRVYFSGTLTITAGGVIQNNGGNAAAAVAGAGATQYSLFGGTSGGAGGTGAGAAGVNQNANVRCFPPTQHGTGGAGGAGSGGAGGAAGTQVAAATVGGSFRAVLVLGANGGFAVPGIGGAAVGGGVGGGAGGGDGAAASGGGGGGGVVFIVARRVIANGATPFLARGGNGAAGTAANCGGGGGGGGGTVAIITRQYNGTALVAATHAPGGALGASGGGAGVAGAVGGTGFVIVLPA